MSGVDSLRADPGQSVVVDMFTFRSRERVDLDASFTRPNIRWVVDR